MLKITLEDVRKNSEVQTLIEYGDKHLGELGFTEHSFRHIELVARRAKRILRELGYEERLAELSAIAGYLHDIGNVVSRHNHSQASALIAYKILNGMDMDIIEVATIMGAIGNHDEAEGQVVNNVTAALILADKSDVHRSRVRNHDFATFDIHDRVNYAVVRADLEVTEKREVILDLTIDLEICSVLDYFEIFLHRMIMCRRAADYLNSEFKILINKSPIL